MERIDPQMVEKYEKNRDEEDFIRQLNAHLSLIESSEDLPEQFPTLHIIGAPRSGTTLLSQILTTHFNIGYINNLIATFWEAPTVGIKLSKKLLGTGFKSSYTSNFGRTSSIEEPHEFGYFWEHHLKYGDLHQKPSDFEDQIDWIRLANTLKNMVHTYERPILFKSFLLGFHIERIQEILPMTCFVNVKRDPIQNALSLLKYRREVLGSENRCGSIVPIEYSLLVDEPYWIQVVGQVYYLEQNIQRQIQNVSGRNVVTIQYETLCKDTKQELDKVYHLLQQHWQGVEFSPPTQSFSYTEATLKTEQDYRDYEYVKQAVSYFYH